MASEALGLGRCFVPGCGARVLYKLDKQGRAYYRCTGGYDPDGRACGSAILYCGPMVTERFIRELKEASNAAVTKRDDVKREPVRTDTPAAPKRKPVPKPEPEPERKPSGGKGGYDFLYEG
ncbi:hypothetical protein [Parvibaculum sp.]|uniref:hypothetical protein n=1 Tax=Parvibaculum sp. TaxID=2024848 RepID=UPI0039198847